MGNTIRTEDQKTTNLDDKSSPDKSEMERKSNTRVNFIKQISQTPNPVDQSEMGNTGLRQSQGTVSDLPNKKPEDEKLTVYQPSHLKDDREKLKSFVEEIG